MQQKTLAGRTQGATCKQLSFRLSQKIFEMLRTAALLPRRPKSFLLSSFLYCHLHRKNRPPLCFAFHAQRSAVQLHDPLGNGQPQPGS